MEGYFQIHAGEGASVALSGDPPTLNTGDTQVQCLEEEATPLWRRGGALLFTHTTPRKQAHHPHLTVARTTLGLVLAT